MKHLVWLALGATFMLAQAPKAVDVTGFDIAGVKLGMSEKEAKDAIMKTLGVSASEIKQPSTEAENPISGKRDITYFTVKQGLAEFYVQFKPNAITPQNSPVVVERITYQLPTTSENAKSIKESAVEKFGKASYDKFQFQWCKNPTNFGCTNQDEAILFTDNSKLVLFDPKYRKALQEWQKKRQTQKAKF